MNAIQSMPDYIRVFVGLIVLTLLEVWVAGVDAGQVLIASALISMALAKAGLVGLYYMHLRYERRLLWYVALFPFVLSAILVLLVLADSTLGTPSG